jgi:hypothetical protein
MYDNIDEQYRQWEQAEASKILEETIHHISMPFTYEELMDLLDRMKAKFTYLYEKNIGAENGK